MKLTRITSKKHPGAVFFKVAGTKDDFICKFYPGHEKMAEVFRRVVEDLDETSTLPPPPPPPVEQDSATLQGTGWWSPLRSIYRSRER